MTSTKKWKLGDIKDGELEDDARDTEEAAAVSNDTAKHRATQDEDGELPKGKV